MSALVQLDGLEQLTLPPRPLHLAIGMFDGVHLGHRAVIEAAVQSARRSEGVAGVLTFRPHPSALFRPDAPTRLLQDTATQAQVLQSLGVDALITQPFTPEFAALEAEGFLPWLQRRLGRLVAVYVGENFRFGRERLGDVAQLIASGRERGVRVFSAPRVNLDGEPISSTRIRALLQAGEVESANGLLGYSYFASGVVEPGKRLGRTLGFPTLNVRWAPELQPRLGVYAVLVKGGASAAPLQAVANYGLRPTVEKAIEPRLEVHLLGACPYDEGDNVVVEWLHFLRPEMKFSGAEELQAQIRRDTDAARAFFARERRDFSLR